MAALVTKTIILLLTNTIKTDANNYPLGRRSALFGCCVDGYMYVGKDMSSRFSENISAFERTQLTTALQY